jgi:hypothetical protein
MRMSAPAAYADLHEAFGAVANGKIAAVERWRNRTLPAVVTCSP